ncbi:hypothetical protein B9Z55_007801 [Caenorhabditis nigoni]|uniref:Uncharacterized protein n=1 Tax=Caenorhabditis nigoni TaxID=1611254 RepID=A0A2G5VBM4_9PELO|nr:hypothetical protein B9Z55_007801 [Caenorhabditis nigoni]
MNQQPNYEVLKFAGLLGPKCREYYQSEKYTECVKNEACRKASPPNPYDMCCVANSYCNFYSTNWFFWLMFFLVLILLVVGIGFCIFYCRRKRRAGRGDVEMEEEPSDTI